MRAALRRCAPAGTSLIVNLPSAPLRAPSVVPTTVMATFEIGAPAVRSVMVPVTRPLPVCAADGVVANASDEIMATLQRARVQIIRRSPEKNGSLADFVFIKNKKGRIRERCSLRGIFGALRFCSPYELLPQ